jgi:hypothetical protein
MDSFRRFLIEREYSKPDSIEKHEAGVDYKSKIGDTGHHVETRFIHGENGHVDVDYVVVDPHGNEDDEGKFAKRFSPAQQKEALRHARNHIKHYLDTEKPASIGLEGNDDEGRKNEYYRRSMKLHAPNYEQIPGENVWKPK